MNRARCCRRRPYTAGWPRFHAVSRRLNTTGCRRERNWPPVPTPAEYSRRRRGLPSPSRMRQARSRRRSRHRCRAARADTAAPRDLPRHRPLAQKAARTCRKAASDGPPRRPRRSARPATGRGRRTAREPCLFERPPVSARLAANGLKENVLTVGRRLDPDAGRWCPASLSSRWRRRNPGAPDRSRTCDLWLRKPTLYPTELRARSRAFYRARRRSVQRCSTASFGHDIM